jgi:hypothetical protein
LARRHQKDHKYRKEKPAPQTYLFHLSPPLVINKAGVDCLKWNNNISAGLIIVLRVFRINGVVYSMVSPILSRDSTPDRDNKILKRANRRSLHFFYLPQPILL